MSLICDLLGHQLTGQTSLHSRFVVCKRCDEHWDEDGHPLKPAFDRAELSRNLNRGVRMGSATYLAAAGPCLSQKQVAKAWFVYLIATRRVLDGKEPPPEQVKQLRLLAETKPDEFTKMILGK